MPTVAPEKILKQLAELWVTTAKEATEESGHGVLRACSMTLVVVAEHSDDVSALGETLAALMPEHPARAIVVRLTGNGGRDLSDRVYAQCWMPFGQRRQICCEQVEIVASDDALGDLPSVVLPLAVPDLPLILWCRGARVLRVPEFPPLAEMATRIVMDSAGFGEPGTAFQWLQAAVSRRQPLVGDLAWTHLTRWREMLALIFENRRNVEHLSGPVRIRVCDGGQVTTRALYLAAWLKDGIESMGMQAAVSALRETETFVELAGGGFSARLERQDERLVTTVNGQSQCTNLPAPTDYRFMREELGIMRRDAVFEKTLASAARLAYATE